ncbi:uncharacterized protein Setx [Drosophila takahashii]|uniref:uncharacterized protein Setx n=1 Tax=Drosophila takahashii TaxID=29030 RepID=UPI003899119E
MSSVWYLQHVTTGQRHILHNGTNLVGRHSRCRIVLAGTYEFVSREHAKFIVRDNGVVVQSMNALNGIFINDGKLSDKINRLPVAEGSIISLGVTGIEKITGIHAIFVLKKMEPTAEEVILSSDDDDTTPLPAVRSPSGNQPTEFNLQQQIPNFGVKKDPSQEEEQQEELPSSSGLHLPKINEVKQEIVNQTTEQIQTIFGEPNDAILNSVLELNPYLYNQLNKKAPGSATTQSKIHDGDCIELETGAEGPIPEEQQNCEAIERPDGNQMPPPQEVVNEEEEYDESFAMSQAVLREMKTEMAFNEGEEDFLDCNGLGNMAEGSPTSHTYDDVVIDISDSEDEELYGKVADWSKLLSQKMVPDVIEMSQTYPVVEEEQQEDSDSDMEIGVKHPSRALRIETSSEDEASEIKSSNDHVVRQADSTTPDPSAIRKCSIRIRKHKPTDNVSSTADVEGFEESDKTRDDRQPKSCLKTRQPLNEETNKSSNRKRDTSKPTTSKVIEEATVEPPKKMLRSRSKSCYMDRIEELDEPLDKKGNKQRKYNEETDNSREELVVTLEAPEKVDIPAKKSNKKGETKKPTIRGRRKTIQSREEFEALAVSPSKQANDEELVVTLEAPKKLNTPTKENNKKVEDKKTPVRGRRKTIHSREEFEALTAKIKEAEAITPTKVTPKQSTAEVPIKRSPRLLNRSVSCFMDRPVTTETDSPIKKITKEPSPAKSDTFGRATSSNEARFSRGPSVIEAPSLPKNRGKLRGVSAEVKTKEKVIERQRLIDYKADMNNKWKQKPKDKKKEDVKIKENRREALKKLSEKPKENESSSRSGKRKHITSVPTVSNSNRGDFLTKEVGPPAKVAKTDFAKPKKPMPARRSTIETFSQHLRAADEALLYPQPLCPRTVERKDAEQARNQRTCNKVTFAEMEQYHQKAEDLNKLQKKLRKVHFNDNVVVHLIDMVPEARSQVQGRKESIKLFLSTYRERHEWVRKDKKPVNDIRQHSRSIMKWANQWLKLGSVEAADLDCLLPISHEFNSFKHYKETFVPLMRLELLSTIERDYKANTQVFSVTLKDFYEQNNSFRLVTKVNNRPNGNFVLYTLKGKPLEETFANLIDVKSSGGNLYEYTFEILKEAIIEERLKELKLITARPVVDSLRVELGALSAVHQLYCSPLWRRIMKPSQTIIEVALPKQPFTFKGFSKLNEHQENIVLRTYQRVIEDVEPSLTLIQGPPGTGKSKVISELCLQTLYGNAARMLDRKILICAHSNTAVDHIVKLLGMVWRAMSHDRFQLLRFGMHERMSVYSRPFSLEAHFNKARERKMQGLTSENSTILKKQLDDLKAEIHQLKQKPNLAGTYLQQQLQQKERQLRLVSDQLNPPLSQREEYEISRNCVAQANIICTTLSSCVKLANYVDFFDICIIDEATQCTEPWTLLPMRFGLSHMVMVGDTQQLPAVVLSRKAIDYGLSNSMFDRVQRSLQKQLDKPGGNQFVHTKIFKLSMQYRMHPEICRWPNKYFYEDQLVNAECTARFASPLIPYCVINLRYTQDNSGAQSRSISNDEEARFVAKLLTEMDKHMSSKLYSYGIISPYQNQCYALAQVIPSHMNLTPLTVDSYQGLEKDVIIISNARTRGCGFLTNYQRLNVALTRPKRCLVICGNFDDLKSVDMWRQLLEDAHDRKVYFDLEREDVDDLHNSLIKKMLVKPIDLA